MKTLRKKLPIVFCIATYILWFLFQSFFGGAGSALGSKNENIAGLAGELGSILIMLIILGVTHRMCLLKEGGMGFGKGFLYGIIIVVMGIVSVFAGPAMPGRQLNTADQILLFTLYMFSIGMAEELLCRGIMAETLLEQYGTDKKGTLKAVLISSLIFGLVHLVNLTSGAAFNSIIMQALQAFIFGCLLSTVYFRTGNLWVTIVIHAIWDFLSIMQMENTLFKTGMSMKDMLSQGVDISFYIINIVAVIYTVILLNRSETYDAISRWFGGYCEKLKEEKETGKVKL
jgi:membrane protease YdiL (CAAX protease family)